MHNQSNPTPVKKTWTHPELVLIAANNIEVTKHRPSIHEKTGHYAFGSNGTHFFFNPFSHGITLVTSQGAVVGHKSSAVTS